MKRFIFYGVSISLTLMILFGGCHKESQNFESVDNASLNEVFMNYTGTDTNIVQYSEAILLAQKLTNNFIQTNSRGLNNRTISNGFSLDDGNDDPAVYVFNYSEGGYSVISADLRYQPILAFVNSGSLNVNDSVPSMFDEWMGYNVEQIQIIRENANPTIEEIEEIVFSLFSWNTELEGFNIKNDFMHMKNYVPTPYPNCPPFFDEISPLMSTSWGQDQTYNNLVPLNCPLRASGKAPTGCVATAVAQLLKYHDKPHPVYNYSLMPNDNGNIQVQDLMYTLGISSNLNMNYHCVNGSGAFTSRVSPTLSTSFSYSNSGVNTSYDASKRWNIVSNIQANLPVYVDGCAINRTTWFKSSYDQCHAWIVDGYRLTGTDCKKHVWFYMNWGWDGFFNGIFYHNDWKPNEDSDFQYNLGMIYNIVP